MRARSIALTIQQEVRRPRQGTRQRTDECGIGIRSCNRHTQWVLELYRLDGYRTVQPVQSHSGPPAEVPFSWLQNKSP